MTGNDALPGRAGPGLTWRPLTGGPRSSPEALTGRAA
jgi:hypothetical protein